MLVLIVTNLLLLGFSQLKSCIRTVACQGIALGVLSLLVNEDGFTVWSVVMSGVVIGLKGVIFPRLLLGALRETNARHEVEPYIGHMASTLAGFAALAASAWLCSRLPAFPGRVTPLVAPVAFFMVCVGLSGTIPVGISEKSAFAQNASAVVLSRLTRSARFGCSSIARRYALYSSSPSCVRIRAR